jgi:hypothetical protein
MKAERDYMTVDEVAKKMNVVPQKIYYLVYNNLIAWKKMFNRYVIPLTEVAKIEDFSLVKKSLLSPKQYCEKNNIKRSLFNYRRMCGYIKTVKIGGRIFVKENQLENKIEEIPKGLQGIDLRQLLQN